MSNHISYDVTSKRGRFLLRALDTSETADRLMREERDCMIQMFEGDGSQDAHYSTIATDYGFATPAAAHAMFLELDTAYAVVGDAGRAARAQLFSKLR